MRTDRVAVLGAGNGGRAIAADLTLAGVAVNLFELPAFAANLEPTLSTGQIEMTGPGRQGMARLALVTTDIEAALAGVELVIVAVPAFGARGMVEACASALRPGQALVFVPGGFSAFIARRTLDALAPGMDLLLGEVATLPYGVRIAGPGHVHVLVEAIKLPTATLPARRTPELVEALGSLFPAVEPAVDVLDTATKNLNPCIHPAPSILNAGWVEKNSDFYLYRDGMTPATRRVMVAVDAERQRVREAWGLAAPHYGLDPTEGSFTVFVDYFGLDSLNTCGIHLAGPHSLKDRYVTEDIPYGLVFFASLGDAVAVDTPACDALIELASIINGVDYDSTGMTLASLGLGEADPGALRKMLA